MLSNLRVCYTVHGLPTLIPCYCIELFIIQNILSEVLIVCHHHHHETVLTKMQTSSENVIIITYEIYGVNKSLIISRSHGNACNVRKCHFCAIHVVMFCL